MKPQTLPSSASMIPVVGLLVLAVVFSGARPVLAQTQDGCPLPAGVTPPPDPRVTAGQVENGSASLREFALAAKDQFVKGVSSVEEALYIGCLVRLEGSPYRSGSTYLVQLTPDRIFVHAKNMALSGKRLNPLIYGAILQALGINPSRHWESTRPTCPVPRRPWPPSPAPQPGTAVPSTYPVSRVPPAMPSFIYRPISRPRS